MDVSELPVFVQVSCLIDAYDGDRIQRPHQGARRSKRETLDRLMSKHDKKYTGAFDKKLLKEYVKFSSKLNIQYVDPDVNPAEPTTLVVFELEEVPEGTRLTMTITDITLLKKELANVRQQGWCLVNQELEEGLVSLSAPIRDRAGRAIAAMNISGQVNRTSPAHMLEHFLPKLRSAAAEISQMLQRKS